MITPTAKKILSSVLFILKIKEINNAIPTIDINDIRAKTADKNENKYQEAKAATTILTTVNNLVCFTALVETIFRERENKTPKAKALESIAPIKAATREITRNDQNHWGRIPRTPSTNKFEGFIVTPANLKLIPRYAIEPATKMSIKNE